MLLQAFYSHKIWYHIKISYHVTYTIFYGGWLIVAIVHQQTDDTFGATSRYNGGRVIICDAYCI